MHPAHSAIFFFLPLVSAMSNLAISPGPTSGGPATITWTADASDPNVCSIELVNPSFHDTFAIANNIPTSKQQINVTLPIVPTSDQYTLEAVQVSNISDVIGTSGAFSIGPTVSTTSSASASSPLSSSSVSATSPATTTGRTTSSGSTSSSSSSSSSSVSPSAFNGNGALGSPLGGGHVCPIAAAVLGIVAGAVLV